MSRIGRVPCLHVKVEGLNTYIDFNVIEIVNAVSSYPMLLGISWEMEKLIIINFKKGIMIFANHDMRVISRLIPSKGSDILN